MLTTTNKFINTPAQYQEREIQKQTMKKQYQHIAAQMQRRIQAAIDRHDHSLAIQLLAEQKFIIKQI